MLKQLLQKLNKKAKSEQLFVLMIMFITLAGVFCVTGCSGNNSCETPKYGNEESSNLKAIGCSIPGCGGCLSSGSGCNSACWPQSCKIVRGTSNNSSSQTDNNEILKITACDTRYYGNNGCGQEEKSCYSGCLKLEDSEININGFFYGTSNSEEKFIGCTNGCGGCIGSEGIGALTIDELESITGVR